MRNEHYRSGKILPLPLFIFLFIPLAGQTTGDSSGTSLDTIKQVIVTGQYRPQPADRSIYPLKVIGSKDIQLRAANNLGELLRSEPGFQVNSADVWGDFMRIRGLTGEHIKILIDGLPVNGRVGDRLDLGQLSLHKIKQVEIVEGPLSVVYGSNALAGAINLLTNDYQNIRFQGTGQFFYESAGTYNANVQFAKSIKKHQMDISGGRNFFNGWSPVEFRRYMAYKPKLQYVGGAGYNYSDNQWKIALLTDFLHEELRDPGELTLANLYEKALDNYQYTIRWNNRLNVIRSLKNNMTIQFQAGYSYYQKRRITYLNDLVLLRKTMAEDRDLHDTTRFHLTSARGVITKTGNDHFGYQAGFDFTYESATGRKLGGFRETGDMAGFMSVLYKAGRLQLQPGIRFIYNTDYKAPVVYGINLKFSGKNYMIRMNHASGFRAPSLKQLYLSFMDSNHEIHGNENLKPETAYNTGISAEYNVRSNRHATGLTVSLYHVVIKHAIQLAISTDRPGWGKYFNVNDMLYQSQGVDLGTYYMHSPGFQIKAGIQLNGISKFGDTRGFYWSNDIYSNLSCQFRKPSVTATVLYKYTDDYMDFAGNYDANGILRNIAQQHITGYHLLDFTATKKLFNQKLSLTGGIRNILNITDIRSVGNLNMHGNMNGLTLRGYGRTYILQVQYIFNDQ